MARTADLLDAVRTRPPGEASAVRASAVHTLTLLRQVRELCTLHGAVLSYHDEDRNLLIERGAHCIVVQRQGCQYAVELQGFQGHQRVLTVPWGSVPLRDLLPRLTAGLADLTGTG